MRRQLAVEFGKTAAGREVRGPQTTVSRSSGAVPVCSQAMAEDYLKLELAGNQVRFSNPDKVFFPELGLTKRDLLAYYLAVEGAALNHLRERPTSLKRYVDGVGGSFFFQKRVPRSAAKWLTRCTVVTPNGTPSEQLVAQDAAHLAWALNLGVIDFNPLPARCSDLTRPDILQLDLDPTPGVGFAAVREVALAVREIVEQRGLAAFPKTSGSDGMHLLVPIRPGPGYVAVRRAALAVAREAERALPGVATSRWWKEERHGVFIDFNQTAPNRTIASAYSVRPSPRGRVSCPLRWSEVPGADPDDYRIDNVPDRIRDYGDPTADVAVSAQPLDPLLELVERHGKEGLGDAPWPPQYPKMPGEPLRVQPSRARKR